VHPAFLPSCNEIVGMFASIYHSGYTREEMIKNTLAHHTCDVIFSGKNDFRAGHEFESNFKMISATKKKSGIRVVTKFVHSKMDGQHVAEGYFGGVILGAELEGEDTVIDSMPERPLREDGTKLVESVELLLPPNAAHIWDACIRDTRVPKAKSSDINVHTNLDLAEKAGFKARTFTGLCLLANVITLLLCKVDTDGLRENFTFIERYGCRFSKPVMALFDSILLDVFYSYKFENSNLTIFFDVVQKTDGTAIKDGYLVLGTKKSHL